MKDFIIVKIIKTNKSLNDKLNINNCHFKAIHFYKVKTCNYNDLPVVQKYQDILQETLPGLSPRREIENKIEIIDTMPKLIPLYKLSLLEDETLKKHLSEALEKNLIYISKSPYRVAVFLLRKKMDHYV